MSGRGVTDVLLPRTFLDQLVSGVSVRVAVDAEDGDDVPGAKGVRVLMLR